MQQEINQIDICEDCNKEINEYEPLHTIEKGVFTLGLCDECYNDRGLTICGHCGEDYERDDLKEYDEDLLCENCFNEVKEEIN